MKKYKMSHFLTDSLKRMDLQPSLLLTGSESKKISFVFCIWLNNIEKLKKLKQYVCLLQMKSLKDFKIKKYIRTLHEHISKQHMQ